MLFFKSYYDGEKIDYLANDNENSSSELFHFEFVEALLPCVLKAGSRTITLNINDMVICQHFKNVQIYSKNSKDICLRHCAIDLKYPAPLNQYLVADNPLIHDFMNDKIKDLRYVVFTNLDKKICHNYMNLLEIFSTSDQDTYIDFQAEKVTGLMFTELLRDHRNKISKNQSDFPSAEVKYASKYTQSGAIITYITSKNGNVTLDQVAKHFGYQKNYLSRLFHKLFNKDFIHFRLIIRMNIACEQLKLTTKSIEEISAELGYKDVSTFTKQFIESNGIKPSLYRKNNTEFNIFE